MEVRSKALKPGKYWLGSSSQIRGKVYLGTAIRIEDQENWTALRDQHQVMIDTLPYKKT